MLHPPRRARRATALLITTVLALVPAANAAAQAPAPFAHDACDRATLAALIVERDSNLNERLQPAADWSWDPLDVRCRDFNRDGIKDALWTLSGGGTGGAFWAGIALSAKPLSPATLPVWVDGSHLMIAVHKRRPVIAWPKYRKGDPNCCASGGVRWRSYRALPDGTLKPSKLQKTKKRNPPFKPF